MSLEEFIQSIEKRLADREPVAVGKQGFQRPDDGFVMGERQAYQTVMALAKRIDRL